MASPVICAAGADLLQLQSASVVDPARSYAGVSKVPIIAIDEDQSEFGQMVSELMIDGWGMSSIWTREQ
jgi:hypothetical protein